MALFNKKGQTDTRSKVLNGAPELIPSIVESINVYFKSNGYETIHQESDNNFHEIQVQKTGTFGLKTVIKVSVSPLKNNRINFKTTDYGLFDSKLDDEALRIAEMIAKTHAAMPTASAPLSGFTAIFQQPAPKQVSKPKPSQPASTSKPNKPRLGGSSGKGSW